MVPVPAAWMRKLGLDFNRLSVKMHILPVLAVLPALSIVGSGGRTLRRRCTLPIELGDAGRSARRRPAHRVRSA